MRTDYVKASGLSGASVEQTKILAGTDGLQNWGSRMVYQKPWQAALAGMFIGLESQFFDICKKIVAALHQHYGWKPRSKEIRFFEEHVHAEEIHGAKGFAIVEKYCTTLALQEIALKAVEDAMDKR
jgi:pyrroloquinoline quinone (PQQ) biosynthesis protein C